MVSRQASFLGVIVNTNSKIFIGNFPRNKEKFNKRCLTKRNFESKILMK